MTITALKKEKQHLTRIIFNDGTELLIDNDICSQNLLKCNTQLSSEEVKKIKYDSDYSRAKSRALWYLDRADHSEKGLYTKLLRAGFDGRACAAVIARFKELDLINDKRFAENYVERCVNANISSREAVAKLYAKGISYDLAKSVVSECNADEEEQISALIYKKYRQKLEGEKGVEKVYAALIRKGFSFSSVKNALKKYNAEIEHSEEY